MIDVAPLSDDEPWSDDEEFVMTLQTSKTTSQNTSQQSRYSSYHFVNLYSWLVWQFRFNDKELVTLLADKSRVYVISQQIGW
jgi:hypothetical protein